jgi:hypothetical protein
MNETFDYLNEIKSVIELQSFNLRDKTLKIEIIFAAKMS